MSMIRQYLLVANGTSQPNAMSYYCVSSTQGHRMLWNAHSMAKRFTSVHEARKKIPELKKEYLGLTNWKAMQVIERL